MIPETILLVDDDPDSREICTAMLEYAGYRVVAAPDGEEGVRRARSERPDLILMDIALPRLSGWDATRILKSEVETGRIPVIAFTAAVLADDRERAREIGFDGYLAKPVEPRRIVAEVRRLLSRPPAELDDEQRAVLEAFRSALRAEGLHAALGVLNRRTEHRFTGVYRFAEPTLRNLLLFDRETPDVRVGADSPMEATYCSIVGEIESPFWTRDARGDARVAAHPARDEVISYCGVLLRTPEGERFGTLCHFDVRAREVPRRELSVLSAVAGLVVEHLPEGARG